MQTSLRAMVHEMIERMKPNKNGQIVNIGSMSADTREKDSSVDLATREQRKKEEKRKC